MTWLRPAALVILLLGYSTASIAESATEELSQLLAPLTSLVGHFSQTIADADGEILQSSQGDFWVQRPGRLRWQTQAPYQQLLVTNEENLWLYDPDLEQVTVKVADKNLQQTPAAILSGDSKVLSEGYHISRIANVAEKDQRIFSLTPIASEALFERLTLRFKGDAISSMALLDSLGQTTTLSLSGITRDAHIDPGMFNFVPPPGTDVLIDD